VKRLVFVVVGENEPFEKVFKKFKRLVEKEGILTEVRRRQFYEKPSEKKKRRERQARKRIVKAMKKRSML
jgi:ribosomal protein S21